MEAISVAHRTGLILKVGLGQLLAWACSFYLPALIAVPMARELGLRTSTVFAAFSAGLLVAAVAGPAAGRWIDRQGGRPVLLASNVMFAVGLIGVSQAQGIWSLFAAWAVMGLGMAFGLYEAAFASVVGWFGRDSRGVMVGVTLLGGFASTVGWPLTAACESHWGWRVTCLVWAASQVVVAWPIHRTLPRGITHGSMVKEVAAPAQHVEQSALPSVVVQEHSGTASLRTTILLAVLFAITLFISTAMAAHLPQLLTQGHVAASTVLLASAIVGPAQVAGRLMELGPLQRVHPLVSARLACALHPLGALAFMVWGAPVAVAFAVVHGIGNGLMTIAKGTLPLIFFGIRGYGERQGLMMIPARLAQSAAPWLFGLWVDAWGVQSLWISAACGALGVFCLFMLRLPPAQPGDTATVAS